MHVLDGKKTYVLVAAGILVTVAKIVGLLTTDTWVEIMALLGFGTVGTLREAVARLRARLAQDRPLPPGDA
jgi:hypothetical protein